ncbi:MAG: hypothetical protein ACOYNC_07855 [Bacteroidales bacterium]
MTRKNKKLTIFSLLLLFSIVVAGLGLKYFPFTKVVRMPAGSEQEFVNPEKKQAIAPHSLYYDFEVAPGKEMPGGFSKGTAHSGQYAVKAFGQNSFSVVVERTAGEIGVENLKAVALSAWIYVFPTKKDVKGSLVFTASNEVGVNVSWHGVAIAEPGVPKGKWFKVSTYIDLSNVQFKPNYKLQMYLWNNSSTDILIDDYFIAFGGAVDRRGDSARVDMTKPAGFIQKFNYPPFPVSMLEKETTGKTINPGEIDAGDYAIAGNFLNSGNDALLVMRKDGKSAVYAFCPGTREFRKVQLGMPNPLPSVGPVKKVLKGRFLPGQPEQFIVVGEKGWYVGAINPLENVCSNTATLQSMVKILWKSAETATSLIAGDFNDDRQAELLQISGNGSWKVMSFSAEGKTGAAWKVISTDDNKPLPEWDSNVLEVGVSAGRFMPGVNSDVALTVTRNKSDGKYAWSLKKLNIPGKTWDPLIGKNQDHQGKTIGLDTLKPTDIFFALPGEGNKMTTFRYNRDWRYDMKEIRFNDTTFVLLSGVDFHGYDKDQNPKYYESLMLVPGCFLKPASALFLVSGHVAKARHYESTLPDFVHLYSLPANK